MLLSALHVICSIGYFTEEAEGLPYMQQQQRSGPAELLIYTTYDTRSV